MSILVQPDTKILVQGITGSFGARHTQLSLAYGTQVVAGVTPGKGSQMFEGKLPIFSIPWRRSRQAGRCIVAIFVSPPPFAADAIPQSRGRRAGLSRLHHGEHFVNDMVKVKRHAGQQDVIGPNCPGVVTEQARIPMAAVASASRRVTSIRKTASWCGVTQQHVDV